MPPELTLPGLFASAFLAATLLPMSSEAVLAALSLAEGAQVLPLLAVASIGNILGAVVNWALGRWMDAARLRRWCEPARLERAAAWFRRHGQWSLLLSWLPLIGDPLTFVAGAARLAFWRFLALVAIGKVARYVAVLAAARGAFA